jgi:hypothetical protein
VEMNCCRFSEEDFRFVRIAASDGAAQIAVL